VPAGRQGDRRHQPRRHVAHVRRAGARTDRADHRRRGRREEPVRLCAVRHVDGASHDHVHVPYGEGRPLPLAVLRALRRRLDRRLRRPDADDRVHGRLPGRRLMATPATREGNHAKRVIVAAIVLSVVATVLVAVLGGRFLPPSNSSTQASEQVFDNTWMTAIVTPVIVLLLVFFVYTLTQFRHRGGALVDGPPIRDTPQVRVLWIVITSVTVLFLAGFGTYELLQNGSGGGQGPSPIAIPKGKMLPVQVIAQQWQFTYRYPTFGGLETPQLVLPANTYVELHVTSLDAIHSFWATELGIEANARVEARLRPTAPASIDRFITNGCYVGDSPRRFLPVNFHRTHSNTQA